MPNREIYLDNAATTRPYDEVAEYVNHIGRNAYGNPSSLHTKGIEAERLVKKAREAIASPLGVDAKEIYFTSGGTESNNLAIRGYLEANPRKGKHIITSAIEHPSILEVYKHLSDKGYRVDVIGVESSGRINLEQLKEKISGETALISIIHTNNEVGTIQPIEEIAAIKNTVSREAVLHVDAVQAYGKTLILPKKQGIDMLSVSSHKIHGPKGTGALYVSKGVKIKPILFGGGQESLIRSGTENVPGICGFGLASELTFGAMEANREKTVVLKAMFVDKLREDLEGFKIVTPELSSPYILNISFGGVRAEVLLHHLEEKSIFVSTGSACSSRRNKHSHVLQAMGLPPSDIEGAVRISFSSFNTEEDVVETVTAMKEIVPKIRRKGYR